LNLASYTILVKVEIYFTKINLEASYFCLKITYIYSFSAYEVQSFLVLGHSE